MLNGEIPTPKNEKEKERFKGRGVAFIENESEAFMIDLFFNALGSNGMSLTLNYEFARDYCLEREIKACEIWGDLMAMLSVANSALQKKLEKGK